MKNTYRASLINEQNCNFENGTFTNMKELRSWAAGRSGDGKKYEVQIRVNGERDASIIYQTR